MDILHTQRLVLRPLTADDAPALHDAFADPEAMRYWMEPPHECVSDTEAMLEALLGRDGACHWAMCLRGSDEALGYVGFLGDTAVPGLGYLLRRAYWGQGYTTEAAKAALAYGFERLGLDRAEAWIHEGNAASRRVAEKAGFRLRGQIRQRWPDRQEPHNTLVYGLLASEWAAAQGRPALPAPEAWCYDVHPVLRVPDVVAAVDFYVDVLGFRRDFLYGDPPTHASVRTGLWSTQSASVHFSAAQRAPGVEFGELYLFVGDGIETLYDRCQSRGVTIVDELADRPWGMREFAVADLYGYQLRFGRQA
jgi:RimJ/RimL family protein N-acetyltransferase/uncharacterized glyoxalase superfamily protein PhnB